MSAGDNRFSAMYTRASATPIIDCLLSGRLKSHLRGAGDVLDGLGVAHSGTMPDAVPESGDVDLIDIGGIRDDPVSEFEIESSDAIPGLAPVGGAPGRSFE